MTLGRRTLFFRRFKEHTWGVNPGKALAIGWLLSPCAALPCVASAAGMKTAIPAAVEGARLSGAVVDGVNELLQPYPDPMTIRHFLSETAAAAEQARFPEQRSTAQALQALLEHDGVAGLRRASDLSGRLSLFWDGSSRSSAPLPPSAARALRRANEIQYTLRPYGPETAEVWSAMRRAIIPLAPRPRVFYSGMGYDFFRPLLAADYSELVGISQEEKEDSLPEFCRAILLAVEALNAPPGRLPGGLIKDADFSRLGPNRYRFRFTYENQERTAVFYQKHDGTSEEPLPAEINEGVDVIFTNGSGLYATPRKLQQLARLLEVGSGFVAYNNDIIKLVAGKRAAETTHALLNRMGSFELLWRRTTRAGQTYTLLRKTGSQPATVKP